MNDCSSDPDTPARRERPIACIEEGALTTDAGVLEARAYAKRYLRSSAPLSAHLVVERIAVGAGSHSCSVKVKSGNQTIIVAVLARADGNAEALLH